MKHALLVIDRKDGESPALRRMLDFSRERAVPILHAKAATADPFAEGELGGRIRSEGIDYVLVTGGALDDDLRRVVRKAKEHGLAVTVLTDTVTGMEPDDVGKPVEDLLVAGAQFMRTEDILRSLDGRELGAGPATP